jgi:hypothetical protein
MLSQRRQKAAAHEAPVKYLIQLSDIKIVIMPYNWSQNDYKRLLKQQLILLKNSFRMFDCGSFEEYLRIAQIVRILVHDTNHSKSLLFQMNIKDNINYINVHNRNENHSFTKYQRKKSDGYVFIKSGFANPGQITRSIRSSEMNHSTMNFEDWWINDNLLEFDKKNWNRKMLILSTANTLGGAHIDDTIESDLVIIYKEKNIFEIIEINQKTLIREIRGDVLKSIIRQIGYEIFESIKQHCKYLKF